MTTSRERRFSFRRRVAIATAAIAMFALGATTLGFHANAAAKPVPTKATLGAANVTAVAAGLRVPFLSHQGEDAEAEVPYASSQLGAGGTGHAVTSIFWPGSTGASFGSTLGVLGIPGLPTSLTNSLNDPYKAEAPSVDGKDTVSLNQGAVTMQAIAKPTLVSAISGVGPATDKALSQVFGSINTATKIRQTADKVIVDAKAAIANISIGGVLSIGSVVSTAHAVTNGTHSHGTTSTQVAGLKIAGINVTVDQNGVEISGKGLLPPLVLNTLTKTVNNALKTSGIELFVAQGTKKIKGASVNLDSGDLIIALNNHNYTANLNDTGVVLELGGASITANGSPGYVAPSVQSSIPPTSPPVAPAPSGSSSVPLPSTGGSVPSAPSLSTPPSVAPPPQVAPAAFKLPGRLAAGWVVLGLILAGLFAFGMKRLPDQVLAASGPACRLEEDS